MPYYDVSAKDRDMMIRTVIGEAEDQPPIGQAAVAHVIMNRVRQGYANSPTGVVLSPHQFEPWSTRSQSLMRINPNGQRYQKAARYVDGVISGEIPDPTGGMTHFLEPNIVMGRYGHLPDWAQGKGLRLGDHIFYAPGRPDVIQTAMASNAPQTAQDAITQSMGGRTGQSPADTTLAFADTAAAGLRNSAPQEPDIDAEARALRGEAGQPGPSTSVDQRFPNAGPSELGDDAIDEEAKNLRGEAEQPDTAAAMRAETADAPIPAQPDEQTGQTLNRWLSENQGSSLLEGAARTGIGGLKGIQDVSNTLAQGISWLGVKGAQAAEGLTLGKYKGEPVQPFKGAGDAAQKWRDGINKRIDEDNSKFDELAGITGQVGRIGGNIAGTAIPGGVATKLPAAAKAISAAPTLIKGAGAGGLTALLSSSSSNEDISTQVGRGAALGALGGAAPKVAKWFDKQVHESRLTQIGIAALLGSAGMGHYAQDPSALQKDLAVAGAAALAIKAGKHADKIAPILSRALATPTGVDVTVKPAMEMLGAR